MWCWWTPASQPRSRCRSPNLTKDADQSLVLTATPAAQSRILGWTGCDLVSADRTQCTIGLAGSRDLLVNFGSTAVGPGAPFLDLSGATNTLYPNVVDVVVDPTDTALIARLAALQVNDYIVGSTGDGFLRRVVAVERVDATHYRLETVDAALDEVVGTVGSTLTRVLTNGDLAGYQAPTAQAAARVSTAAFSGLPGISLVPSSNPENPVFHLQFGAQKPAAAAPPLGSAAALPPVTVTLYEEGQHKVTATGTLDVSLDVNFSAASVVCPAWSIGISSSHSPRPSHSASVFRAPLRRSSVSSGSVR